ncbi:MAG: ATP-grasp domain-containing protein, partial [Nitriliruptor sp.]
MPRAVLIANRGEIAVRIARTCRAMGIRAVGVASEVDADATHVHACDDVVMIGGASPGESYLRGDALIAAAHRAGADAIHPGFGFLAEDPRFAAEVLAAGLTWIGPSPQVIATMGDKLEAKRRMAEAGVPLVPGEELPPEPTAADLHAAAERIGLPIMVKAAGGGGGKGMRAVHHLGDLADAVAAAQREAGSAFGDDRVFLERLIARPRHVEVQVVGDTHGQVLHLFERECSIQRRHQKVVEECPSPGIDAEVRGVLTAAATDAARALGYVSAGTVEFVVDEDVLARRRAGESVPATEAVAFLEVNTRLQVEHPVTEEVVAVRDEATGTLEPIDLVRWQLLVAGGFPLPATQDRVVARGHSIEVRLYAEDVPAGYLPATGRLTAFRVPALPGIRRELGVRAGEAVTPHYDPMLAKVIATAPTRHEAAGRLAAALAASSITGVTTNRDLLVAVLRDDRFLAGATTTAFLAD